MNLFYNKNCFNEKATNFLSIGNDSRTPWVFLYICKTGHQMVKYINKEFFYVNMAKTPELNTKEVYSWRFRALNAP